MSFRVKIPGKPIFCETPLNLWELPQDAPKVKKCDSSSIIQNAVTGQAEAPQGYDKGYLMMKAYIERIKANSNTQEKLTALVNANTNTITRYI